MLTNYYEDHGIYSSLAITADSAWNRKEWVNPENTDISACKYYEFNEKDQLYKSTINRFHTNFESYSIFHYNDQGRIEKQIFYYQDTSDSYLNYIYDSLGNLTLKEHYIGYKDGLPFLSNKTEYYFDNKNNAYKAFESLNVPGMYSNINNIVKEVYTLFSDVDGSVEDVRIRENSYEYNELDYPVRKNEEVEFFYK
jgi:hypothetical protein